MIFVCFLFLEKLIEVCSPSNLSFSGLIIDFFLNSVHFFHLKEGKSTIELRNCIGHEKRYRHLISKIFLSSFLQQKYGAN